MTKHQTLIISILALVFSTFACQENPKDSDIVEGDLFFRPFRYGSFYNMPDSLVRVFVAYADTAKVESLSTADKESLKTYFLLKKENRLFSPFVELRLIDSSIVKLYLDSVDYDRIKLFKRQELQAANKKIKIKAQITDIGNGLLICTKLISVDKIDGLTMQQQRKFEINDYE